MFDIKVCFYMMPIWLYINTMHHLNHWGRAMHICVSELGQHFFEYRKTSSIRCTLVGNKSVNHSDVVGASPVGAAPTTSSFPT